MTILEKIIFSNFFHGYGNTKNAKEHFFRTLGAKVASLLDRDADKRGQWGARPPIPENSMFLPPNIFGWEGGHNFWARRAQNVGAEGAFIEKI